MPQVQICSISEYSVTDANIFNQLTTLINHLHRFDGASSASAAEPSNVLVLQQDTGGRSAEG
jgi:hypothetical protein